MFMLMASVEYSGYYAQNYVSEDLSRDRDKGYKSLRVVSVACAGIAGRI